MPFGYYSEEAQEAQNKEICQARLNHLAKINRVNVMKNQFHFLLAQSDPVFSSIRFKGTKSEDGKLLSPEVLYLLKK